VRNAEPGPFAELAISFEGETVGVRDGEIGALRLPVDLTYTPNNYMRPPEPSSRSQSRSRRPGRPRKGLGEMHAALHSRHHPRERTYTGPIGESGGRHAVSFNQVVSGSPRAAGAGRPVYEGFRRNPPR
jgi:hypothetical protein